MLGFSLEIITVFLFFFLCAHLPPTGFRHDDCVHLVPVAAPVFSFVKLHVVALGGGSRGGEGVWWHLAKAVAYFPLPLLSASFFIPAT